MRYSDNAKWCYLSSWCAYLSPRSWQFMGLVLEIDKLDKAHKRAKRALRQQQKYILKLQKELKYYKHVNSVLQYENEMLEEYIDEEWL